VHVGTVHQIQALARGRRKDLGLSQGDVAQKAGFSRKWLSDFERGATMAAELPLVLRLLVALGLSIEIAASPNDENAAQIESNSPPDLDAVLRSYKSAADGPHHDQRTVRSDR
jgi:HTH-type transcriptional regulator / antitoxin HipB